jgi:hypothetical protein
MLARSLCKMLFVFLFPAFAVAVQEAPAPHVADLTAPDGLKLKGTFSAAAASGARRASVAPVQPAAQGVGRPCDAHDGGRHERDDGGPARVRRFGRHADRQAYAG